MLFGTLKVYNVWDGMLRDNLSLEGSSKISVELTTCHWKSNKTWDACEGCD